MFRLFYSPLPLGEKLLGAGLLNARIFILFYLDVVFLRLSTGLELLLLQASVPQSLVAQEDLGCLDGTPTQCPSLWAPRLALFLLSLGVGLNTCPTAHPDISLGFLPRGFCSLVHSPVPLATFTYFGLQRFQLSPSFAENGVCEFSFPVLFVAFGCFPGGRSCANRLGRVHTKSCLPCGSLLL